MYCRKCGVENPDNAKFCTDCGEKLDVSQTPNQYSNPYQSQSQYPYPPQSQSQYPYPPQPQPQYIPPYYQQNMYMQEAAANSAATSSLTCGIVGLFVVGLILGIIAISQSNKAKSMGYIGGKATAGLILGIIDIIGAVIVMIALISQMANY